MFEMGGGGWKRVALDGKKERFVQKKGFWFVKMEFFADSRLRGVEMGSGGQKRVALDGNKKVCAKEKLLVCENWKFLRTAKKGTCKRSFRA